MNALFFCLFIKINDAEHDTMIRDRYTIHAELFDSCNQLFNFIRAIQQAILCMDMQMCKIHPPAPFLSIQVECMLLTAFTKSRHLLRPR